MRKLSKWMTVLAASAMVAVGVMGCGNTSAGTNGGNSAQQDNNAGKNNENGNSGNASDSSELKGKVTMAGSTSMEKLANALAEAFMDKYPSVTVTAEFTGSGAGLESLAAGSVDIGNASRALSDKEKDTGAIENIVALDGIAVITDTANIVTNLTSEELSKIYTGEITNWSALGGEDEQIVVIGRESGSGTRSAFEELIGVQDACNYAQELDSTGAVLAKVASTPGAVGYVSLDVVDSTVIAMSLNSVEATEANILKGDYVLSRPFVMATMGQITEQSDTVQAFFEFLQSEEGQAVIRKVGLILPEQP